MRWTGRVNWWNIKRIPSVATRSSPTVLIRPSSFLEGNCASLDKPCFWGGSYISYPLVKKRESYAALIYLNCCTYCFIKFDRECQKQSLWILILEFPLFGGLILIYLSANTQCLDFSILWNTGSNEAEERSDRFWLPAAHPQRWKLPVLTDGFGWVISQAVGWGPAVGACNSSGQD